MALAEDEEGWSIGWETSLDLERKDWHHSRALLAMDTRRSPLA